MQAGPTVTVPQQCDPTHIPERRSVKMDIKPVPDRVGV